MSIPADILPMWKAEVQTYYEHHGKHPSSVYGPPNLSTGRCAYYKRPATQKYGDRIYLFLDWHLWNRRNMLPMGLYNGVEFYVRDMTIEERINRAFSWRLKYVQFESMQEVISYHAAIELSIQDIEKECSEFLGNQTKLKL